MPLIYYIMDEKIVTKIIADANAERIKSKGTLRLGQCMWNIFESYFFNNCSKEENAKFQKLRGSDKDPFYNDKLINVFIEEVSKI